MPLARAHHDILVPLFRYGYRHGWKPDPYPHCWHSEELDTYVRFDAAEGYLVVSRAAESGPRRWRVAVIPVDTVPTAVNALAALGIIPADLSPLGCQGLASLGVTAACDRNGPHELDSPADFADAGRQFADRTDGRISAGIAAEVLSQLAGAGLIASSAYLNEIRVEPTAADTRLANLRLLDEIRTGDERGLHLVEADR